jgi:hypothetical protein
MNFRDNQTRIIRVEILDILPRVLIIFWRSS